MSPNGEKNVSDFDVFYRAAVTLDGVYAARRAKSKRQ